MSFNGDLNGSDDGLELTTKGQIHTFSTEQSALNVGSNSFILSANSSATAGLEWVANTDAGLTLGNAGDIHVRNASDNVALAITGATTGDLLTCDTTEATKMAWKTPAGGGTSLLLVCGDESTAISSIGQKFSYRQPEAMTLNSGISGIKGSLVTAGTGADLLTVDIRDANNASSSTIEAGATADTNAGTSYLTYKQITGLNAGDKITAVTFDAYSYTSTSFKCGVYSDNSNQPQTLLGSGSIASGSLVNTYTTVQCTLDTPVIATSDKVWVAMIMDTNTVNLRVTSSGASYSNSVYATGAATGGDGLYSNYANMLFATANITGNGGNNIRSGVVIEESSILSTPLTFDAGETSTITAAVPVVISDTSIAADANLSVHVTGLDTGGVAAGLKISLMGS